MNLKEINLIRIKSKSRNKENKISKKMHGKNHQPKTAKCNKHNTRKFAAPTKTEEDSNHQAAPAPEPSNRATRQKKATARGINQGRLKV